MRKLRIQLCIAISISLLCLLIVFILEKGISVLGVASSLASFLIVLMFDTLLAIQELSHRLRLHRSIGSIGNPFMRKYARKLMDKFIEDFEGVQKGELRFDSESSMMDVYYDVLKIKNSRKILATSIVNINHVWQSARGKKAVHENKDACERGIKIQRIFIFPDKAKRDDEESSQHMELQKGVGVDVKHVLAADLSPDLQKDFLINDNNIVLEYRVNLEGKLIECFLSCNERKADEYRNIYDQILSAAEDYE